MIRFSPLEFMDMGPLIFYPKSDQLGIQRIKKIQTESKSTDL